MIYAYSKKKVDELCFNADIVGHILWLEENIEISKKTSKNFISEKRKTCPRFYFIPDDKLLQIYGSLNPLNSQDNIVLVILLSDFFLICYDSTYFNLLTCDLGV